jgi:hypothetical protein
VKRLALAVAALAACSSNSPTVTFRFAGPAAIVQFYGVTRNGTAVRPYLAVADARNSDLRLIDPAAGQPVLGPAIVNSLSIVTLPRPLFLASASLGDRVNGGADVLVAGSAGDPDLTLQVVDTWNAQNVVVDAPVSVQLAGFVAPGSEILAMVGVTPAAASPTNPLGRILVALTGQQLVSVDFTRGTDGAVVPGAPVVQQLGFDALDLSVGPSHLAVGPSTQPFPTAVYAATRDALSLNGVTVHGAVEIDASGATPFTTTVYDALAPTVAVAAALVDERSTSSSDSCAAENDSGQQVPKIYVAFDPQGCGPDKVISCGIATIDPTRTWTAASGQLAADPGAAVTQASAAAGFPVVVAQAFRAPMPVPGVPLRIAIANAPAKNANPIPTRIDTPQSLSTTTPCHAPGSPASPLARVLYGSALRGTSALAMVTSTDGHVYWLDLSRFAPVVDSSATQTGLSATSVLLASTDSVGANQWQLGLWFDDAVVGTTASNGAVVLGTVLVDASKMPGAIEVWPGFTPSAIWTATYQGALPGLSARSGAVAVAADGSTAWAAPQSKVGTDGSQPASWSAAVPVGDPAFGVNENDFVELPDVGCETTVKQVLTAAEAAALTSAGTGGVAFPGGALELDLALHPCAALTPGAQFTTQLTVLGSDVVVSSDVTGYVGRAPISLSSTDPADGVFALAWKDESALTGKDLAIARRARRIFYPTDGPCPLAGATSNTTPAKPVGCYSLFPRLADPLSPGAALRFRLGLRNITTPALPATAADRPPRGATVRITTQSGLTQSSRRPVTGGTPSAALVAVDPGDLVYSSNDYRSEDFRFYATYQDDQVAWFWSTSTTSQVTSLR